MQKKEKIAALIFAHNDFSILDRLIKTLKHPRIDIFLHISYFNNYTFEELDALKKNEYLNIIPIEIKTYLDDYSLVVSVLETIKYAGKNYKYYIKLSGQDYPIKPIDSLINHLDTIYPKPLLDCTPFDKSNWIYHKLHQPRWYSYLLIRGRKYIKIRLIKRLVLILPYLISKGLDKIYNYEKAAANLNLKIFGGSPMWILSDKLIEDILNFSNQSKNKKLKLLKKIWTVEEVFFQTVSMMTNYNYLVELNAIDAIAQNCQTYNYFTDDDKPFKGHPYILTKHQLPLIKSLPSFFARKFSSEIDTEVLDIIDNEILHLS